MMIRGRRVSRGGRGVGWRKTALSAPALGAVLGWLYAAPVSAQLFSDRPPPVPPASVPEPPLGPAMNLAPSSGPASVPNLPPSLTAPPAVAAVPPVVVAPPPGAATPN